MIFPSLTQNWERLGRKEQVRQMANWCQLAASVNGSERARVTLTQGKTMISSPVNCNRIDGRSEAAACRSNRSNGRTTMWRSRCTSETSKATARQLGKLRETTLLCLGDTQSLRIDEDGTTLITETSPVQMMGRREKDNQ